ncbi:MAG TPA: NUDIX hydrolase [Magnetospirillum sp.]|nr:NUDIX hydrolase [Magnetospirillum sp.]
MPKENTKKSLVQYAALPYRVVDGHPEVLLVTSRETKRWILPKGQPERKLAPHQVAETEAYEEAGLVGTVFKAPFAQFDSFKRLKNGCELPCLVRVYLLEVDHELDAWPEKHERERRWMTPGEAALLVTEAGLVRVLLDFGGRFD